MTHICTILRSVTSQKSEDLKIVAVYSKECEKHINLLHGKNAEIINVTAVGVSSNHCVEEGVSDRERLSARRS